MKKKNKQPSFQPEQPQQGKEGMTEPTYTKADLEEAIREAFVCGFKISRPGYNSRMVTSVPPVEVFPKESARDTELFAKWTTTPEFIALQDQAVQKVISS